MSIIFFLLFSFSFNKIRLSFAETEQELKIRLQKELIDLENQIKEQQNKISNTQAESATLSRDISLLQSQINKKQLEIKKTDKNIELLSEKIYTKNKELINLSESLDKQKIAIANTLRNLNLLDSGNNLLNIVLNSKSLSQFFEDSDKIIAIQNSINADILKIKNISKEVEDVKFSLEDDKDTQISLKVEQNSAKNKISASKLEKDSLLKETKGQEALYKKQLAEKQAKAAEIKARLFSFAGGETKAIPFGTALQYAEDAEKKTGVPAAFVLAILTQESALGANVGKCYLSDLTTGAGYNINSKVQYPNVMKASRDIEPFISITKSLGMNPLNTIVSCPIPSAGGYGGAMGPAQFIPSTWEEVQGQIAVYNPWNAKDAILASSYYLSTRGASNSYASQVKAACKYYGSGGASCSYGTQVMNRVDNIQNDINNIKQYSN